MKGEKKKKMCVILVSKGGKGKKKTAISPSFVYEHLNSCFHSEAYYFSEALKLSHFLSFFFLV